jgi:hypothetical protein
LRCGGAGPDQGGESEEMELPHLYLSDREDCWRNSISPAGRTQGLVGSPQISRAVEQGVFSRRLWPVLSPV